MIIIRLDYYVIEQNEKKNLNKKITLVKSIKLMIKCKKNVYIKDSCIQFPSVWHSNSCAPQITDLLS